MAQPACSASSTSCATSSRRPWPCAAPRASIRSIACCCGADGVRAEIAQEESMLTVTRDLVLPTAITGSYPRPLWFTESLRGRSFKAALGDSLFREQYLDAVAAIINAQEAAGLDIVTDGDSRFDLVVGGKSWFFYPIERLGGIEGHRSTSQGWMARHDIRPGKILWEVQEAYQPAVVKDKLSRGALEYAALWQIAQRLSSRPVKFGAICAPALASMLWNEHYP